jgi:microcystin-dependent protein
MTGMLTLFSVDPTLNLNKSAAGQLSSITSYTNGSVRWQLRLGDSIAESGGNAGANFVIARYSDVGGSLGDVFSINRATGVATFAQPVPSVLPAGLIVPFAGATAPPGWLLCFGQLVSTTTYAALFAAIGSTYGTGSGLFGVPDLRGRAAFGKDDMGGTPANKLTNIVTGGIVGATLGAVGGEQAHTLTTPNELPAHAHATASGLSFKSAVAGQVFPGGSGAANITNDSMANAGSSLAHNTVPPGIVLNYIISTGGP